MLFIAVITAFCSCLINIDFLKLKITSKKISNAIETFKYNAVDNFPDALYSDTLSLTNKILNEDIIDTCDCFISSASQLALFGLANNRFDLFNKVAEKGEFIPFIKGRLYIEGIDVSDPDFTNRLAPIDLLQSYLKSNQVLLLLSNSQIPLTRKLRFLSCLLTTEIFALKSELWHYLDILPKDDLKTGLIELQMKYLIAFNTANIPYFNLLKSKHTEPQWTMFNSLDVVFNTPNSTPNHLSLEIMRYMLQFELKSEAWKHLIVALPLPSGNNELMEFLLQQQQQALDFMPALTTSIGFYKRIRCESVFRRYINEDGLVGQPLRQYGMLLQYLFLYGGDFGLDLLAKTGKLFYWDIRRSEFVFLNGNKHFLYENAVNKQSQFSDEKRRLMANYYVFTLARLEATTNEAYLMACDAKMLEFQKGDNPIKEYLPTLNE